MARVMMKPAACRVVKLQSAYTQTKVNDVLVVTSSGILWKIVLIVAPVKKMTIISFECSQRNR